MKKNLFLSMLMLTAFAFTSTSQVTGPKITADAVGYALSATTHATTDTLTNAVSKSQFFIARGSNVHVTVQPTFTKISGTVAGTAKLQGSILGVDYVDIASQTLTLTDVASQTFTFTVVPSQYQYYKVLFTPSGTQSTKVKTAVLLRKYP